MKIKDLTLNIKLAQSTDHAVDVMPLTGAQMTPASKWTGEQVDRRASGPASKWTGEQVDRQQVAHVIRDKLQT